MRIGIIKTKNSKTEALAVIQPEPIERIDKHPAAVYLTDRDLIILPPKPSRDGDEARELIEEKGLPIFEGGIRRFVAFQNAALAGVTVDLASDPHASDGWNDYLEIGRQ
ncbi:MAG: hypothetical protein IPJ07_14505 [Acidobacteria bacterium]|nr:hypothetical protein [Acidobacteriota bacterium]